jgi:hypothetical protein
MNDDEIDQISRSFIGHLATDPDVRAAGQAAVAQYGDPNDQYTALADIINTAVNPAITCSADDMPAIIARINALFGPPSGGVQTEQLGNVGNYVYP